MAFAFGVIIVTSEEDQAESWTPPHRTQQGCIGCIEHPDTVIEHEDIIHDSPILGKPIKFWNR